MKKLLILAMAILSISMVSNAQVMKKGDNAFNIGAGIPAVASMKMPAVIASFDHGFSGKLGIGYITGGGQFSIYRAGYNYYTYNTRTTYIGMGARVAYHFDFVDITGNKAFEKLDIYAGILASITISDTKYKYTNGDVSDFSPNVGFQEDVFIGIRYALKPAFSLFAEAGYGVAYLRAGLAFRF